MIIDVILGYITPLVLLIAAGYLIKTFRDDKVMKYVKIAVTAAEQIFNEAGLGQKKFEYVSKWISKKFKISEEDLRNLIESAVYEMNSEVRK